MRAMGSLAIARLDDESAARSAALSAAWDRALRADAELVVAVPSDAALVLGAFQRKRDVADADARRPERAAQPHMRGHHGEGGSRHLGSDLSPPSIIEIVSDHNRLMCHACFRYIAISVRRIHAKDGFTGTVSFLIRCAP